MTRLFDPVRQMGCLYPSAQKDSSGHTAFQTPFSPEFGSKVIAVNTGLKIVFIAVAVALLVA